MKLECECEVCGKLVAVKKVKVTKEGKVYVTLKCGHTVAFRFGSVIYPLPIR